MKLNLVGLDETGVKQSHGKPNLRLVCLIEGGGKLAVWGSPNSRKNIDTILKHGMPCSVDCTPIQPEQWAMSYGHTYWLPEDGGIAILA